MTPKHGWVSLGEVSKNKNNFSLQKIPSELPLKFGVCSFDRKNRESEKAQITIR